MRNFKNVDYILTCGSSSLCVSTDKNTLLSMTHIVFHPCQRLRKRRGGDTALAFASVAGIFSVTELVYQFSCIQRFGTLYTWVIPNAETRKRQVSSDGQEPLLMSLPTGSILPVSERSHHEPNLCSVPVPLVWRVSLTTRHRSPYESIPARVA